MKAKNLPDNGILRVALDLDDTLVDWIGEFKKKFPNLDWSKDHLITKKVYSIRTDKQFWENLPLLERPNFEPAIYATKRINSKKYTRTNLVKHNLPIKPIYQIYHQKGNKADIIKGHCDVLIDDSAFNVRQAIKAGLPAILITRPHNAHVEDLPRIQHITMEEITEVYIEHFCNES